MRVQLSSSDKMFGFTHAAGTEFASVAQLKDSTFALERDNTAALITRCCSLTVKIPHR